MSVSIPKINESDIIESFTPVRESVRADILRYGDELERRAGLHESYNIDRERALKGAESGSYEQYYYESQLNRQRFLTIARDLNRSNSDDEIARLSGELTQASIAVFGKTDEHLAKKYADGENGDDYMDVAQSVAKYLNEKYGKVFECLGFDGIDGMITAEDFASSVERVLRYMSRNIDQSWSEWSVARRNKGSLAVSSVNRTISVGIERVPMTPVQAKGLFAHEVLMHAGRALNGEKISDDLRTGLENYSNVEEGFGVLFEYAITGNIPAKNIERYVDVANALGQLDGKPKTRKELLKIVTARDSNTNEKMPGDKRLSEEQLTDSIFERINRIYRGTKGDNHIGVMTRDILYQRGFVKICKYIRSEMDKGKSINMIMDYAMTCKFDPTNETHVAKLSSLINS